MPVFLEGSSRFPFGTPFAVMAPPSPPPSCPPVPFATTPLPWFLSSFQLSLGWDLSALLHTQPPGTLPVLPVSLHVFLFFFVFFVPQGFVSPVIRPSLLLQFFLCRPFFSKCLFVAWGAEVESPFPLVAFFIVLRRILFALRRGL